MLRWPRPTTWLTRGRWRWVLHMRVAGRVVRRVAPGWLGGRSADPTMQCHPLSWHAAHPSYSTLTRPASKPRTLQCDAAGQPVLDERGRPKRVRVVAPIGLVIDLTRSTRYYDPKNWLDRGVKYVKVSLPGCVGHPWCLLSSQQASGARPSGARSAYMCCQ